MSSNPDHHKCMCFDLMGSYASDDNRFCGLLALPWEASSMFAMITVTALSALIINIALTVIPGEFLSGIEPPKLGLSRKPNGG